MEESSASAPLEKTLTAEDGEAAATIRGDDEVLEGVTIGDTIEEAYSSESDDGEEGIVIHAGRTTSRGTRSHRKSFGKNMTYTRPDALSPHSLMSGGAAKSTARPSAAETEDELKKLRFLRHATAFDVDIDALDDHPWRSKTVDLLDYFNYGFNERTWLIYCEKQLRLRAQKGLGPYQPPLGAPAPTAVLSIAPGPVATVPAPAFMPPVAPTQATVPPPAAPQAPGAPVFSMPGAARTGPPAPPVAPAGFANNTQQFLPPPPQAPQAPTPMGRFAGPGPPMMPSAPMPGSGGPAMHAPVGPPGPPGPPQRAGMPPPPPVPAGFAPPPMPHNSYGPPPSMHQQPQNSTFTGVGGVGPGLDMYGRELGVGGPAGGFGGPPQGPPQGPSQGPPHGPPQGRPFDQQRGGRDWEGGNKEWRGPPRDAPRPDSRDYRNERSDRNDREGNTTEASGKRKFASSEDIENPSKRRTGSNSRDRRDRDRDRDRGRDRDSRVQSTQEKDIARPPLPPKPSGGVRNDRRRDSRDRELPARGDSRDRKDSASSSAGTRRSSERTRDRDRDSDRRARSPDKRRDTRERSADRDRRSRR